MPMSLDDIRELALEQLEESGKHEEQWDLLFATPGACDVVYIPHDRVDDWDFEPEDYGWYEISEKRQQEILAGADATSEEIDNWRRSRAAEDITRVSSECCTAFIVPVYEQSLLQGYAVFDVGVIDGDPDTEPFLVDVFKTKEDAYAAVEQLGVTK